MHFKLHTPAYFYGDGILTLAFWHSGVPGPYRVTCHPVPIHGQCLCIFPGDQRRQLPRLEYIACRLIIESG